MGHGVVVEEVSVAKVTFVWIEPLLRPVCPIYASPMCLSVIEVFGNLWNIYHQHRRLVRRWSLSHTHRG